MKALVLTLAFAAAFTQSRPAAPRPVMMSVYKTPTCGCCAKWVEHMKQNGFTVNVTDLRDLSEIKSRHGVPSKLQSCHTAIVNGYVVEGHVPAADVKKLLKDKPAVAGLTLPNMPQGSPGMEAPPNIVPPPYEVLTFDKKGATRVYSRHGAR